MISSINHVLISRRLGVSLKNASRRNTGSNIEWNLQLHLQRHILPYWSRSLSTSFVIQNKSLSTKAVYQIQQKVEVNSKLEKAIKSEDTTIFPLFSNSLRCNGSWRSTRSMSSSSSTHNVSDVCHHYIVSSPYPSISVSEYPPLFEFVTKNWESASSTRMDKNDNVVNFSDSNSNVPAMIPAEKVAIIDGSTGLQRTYGDYFKTATGLGGFLRYECNVSETSTVAIFCPNHVDYAPTCLAVSLCGSKLTPINPLYTPQELSVVLNRSRSTVIVTHESKIATVFESLRECPNVKHVLVVSDNDAPSTTTSIHSTIGSSSGNILPQNAINLNSVRDHPMKLNSSICNMHSHTNTQPFCIPYSSGTTGLPKGVCLSHYNLIINMVQLYEIEKDVYLPDHKLISPLPFFHIYAFTVSMLYNAWQGQTLITMSQRFDLELFCKLVQKYQPERAHLVPPILLALLGKYDSIVSKYDMSSLQTIVSAAAPLSSETEKAVQERVFMNSNTTTSKSSSCIIKQAWGMSELSPIGTYTPNSLAKSGSVGPLVSSTFAKVIDASTGASLGPNTPGELLLKGPQVMMGYLDDPDKTTDCLSPSGWLRTGDVATYDEDGYFYITDRIKELIKVNGYPVAPAELEALLLTHPSIDDAAVIAIPDENCGELPCAYIVSKEKQLLKSSSVVSESMDGMDNDLSKKEISDDIYKWVKERVAPYKRLNGGIIFKDMIPKSASGKILRRILKDEWNALNKK